MKKKFGFTLSELLFAVAVLCVIIAVVTPSIVKISPDTDGVMVKRAYYTATTTTLDLINNSNLYRTYDEDSGYPYVGFDDHGEVTYKGKTYKDATKFADLFISHLNIKGDIDTDSSVCNDFTSGHTACRTVLTTNGTKWSFAVPVMNDEDQLASYIMVDVNGDKKPNCFVGKNTDACKAPDVVYDQFRIVIKDNGKISISKEDGWAISAVVGQDPKTWTGTSGTGAGSTGNGATGDGTTGDGTTGDGTTGDGSSGDDYSGDDYSGDEYSGDDYSGDDYSGDEYVDTYIPPSHDPSLWEYEYN